MPQFDTFTQVLQFAYNRLVDVHNENPNEEYMQLMARCINLAKDVPRQSIGVDFPRNTWLIGQRVILNGTEIGTVAPPPTKRHQPNSELTVWVYSPSNDSTCRYSTNDIRKLPGGQL